MSDNRTLEVVKRQLAEAIKHAIFVEPDAERDDARNEFCALSADAVLKALALAELDVVETGQ